MSAEPAYWIPRVGDVVDRYEIVAEIARGGMAAVYAVRRRAIAGFGRLLAMKVLLPHLRDEKQFVDMFLDEARLASAIHHPNVVQVFDLGEERATPFLVMEMVRGVSLSDLLREAREKKLELPLPTMFHVLAEAAEGLHAAHETRGSDGEILGIVHRDVSPHNVLLSFDGHVKVADFGIAAGRGRISSTRSGEVRGKLGYLAPEQVKRLHGIDRRVDVWALGVVAYETFAGKKLFQDGDEAAVLWDIVSGDPLDFDALPKGLPDSIRKLIEKCLARDRGDRVTNCREVAEVFAEAARERACRGSTEVEKLMLELVPERKAALDRRLIEVEGEPATEPSDPPASVDRAATTSREVPVAVPARAEQTHTQVAVSSSFAAPAPSRRRLWIALGTALGVLLIALGVRQALRPRAHPASSESVALVAASAPPAPSASETPPAAVKKRITLEVAADVRIVLIAETLRKERPIVLELAPNEQVGVKLVSKAGKIVEREIAAADDGATLSTAAPSEPKKPATGTAKKGPLFSSPY